MNKSMKHILHKKNVKYACSCSRPEDSIDLTTELKEYTRRVGKWRYFQIMLLIYLIKFDVTMA